LSQLQIREVFHLEFLRRLGEKLSSDVFALKGGANLRFFYRSIRYSEDLDLDLASAPAHGDAGARRVSPPEIAGLQKTVLAILTGPTLASTLKTYGIRAVQPLDLEKAKQTETTQRFKIHIGTDAGEDLFTKVEFSRRGFRGSSVVSLVPDVLLRTYLMTPLWIPHYDLDAAIQQKVQALAGRPAVQARDVFDLSILMTQIGVGTRIAAIPKDTRSLLGPARDRIYEIDFPQFRDTVLAYLSEDDRAAYDRPAAWDDLRLRVAGFLEGFQNDSAQ